jgi:hypothetical protein
VGESCITTHHFEGAFNRGWTGDRNRALVAVSFLEPG